MTAPTPEEIRLTVLREWNRRRTDDDIAPYPLQPLSGRVEDHIWGDLTWDTYARLYAPPESDFTGPFDIIAREAMDDVVPKVEAMILEAVALAIERFAREYPDEARAGTPVR